MFYFASFGFHNSSYDLGSKGPAVYSVFVCLHISADCWVTGAGLQSKLEITSFPLCTYDGRSAVGRYVRRWCLKLVQFLLARGIAPPLVSYTPVGRTRPFALFLYYFR